VDIVEVNNYTNARFVSLFFPLLIFRLEVIDNLSSFIFFYPIRWWCV